MNLYESLEQILGKYLIEKSKSFKGNEFNKMMTVELLWLYAMFARPVIPECMKVESPITATVLPSASLPRALLKPWIEEIDAPIHRVISIEFSGATAPRV